MRLHGLIAAAVSDALYKPDLGICERSSQKLSNWQYNRHSNQAEISSGKAEYCQFSLLCGKSPVQKITRGRHLREYQLHFWMEFSFI